MRVLIYTLFIIIFICSCHQTNKPIEKKAESKEAKTLLQGIWLDEESGNVIFMIKGDSIFYPDTTSMPTDFRVVNDTMLIGHSDVKYSIEKQMPNVFWFKNQNGDVVKLMKSNDAIDSLAFKHKKPEVLSVSSVVKKDTVVMCDNVRYHCYVVINPTKYKVVKSSYNDDGMKVDNVYYDNIIHVSIFQGTSKIFSRNFSKKHYAEMVPSSFLKSAILKNIEFDKAQNGKFYFDATLCIPDAASCYMVETIIDKKGETTMKLLQY